MIELKSLRKLKKVTTIFRPFQRGSLPNIWDVNSDYYLHFKPNLNRQNEYLQWSVNVTSDTEDSEEEWLDDWLQVKANEAGIRIGNDFSESFVANRFKASD